MAILVDFLLQVTIFAAIVSLDAKRKEDNRVDCVPCVKIRSPYDPDFADESEKDNSKISISELTFQRV